MIRTKVARIVSPTQVVLAAGSEQGVREGIEFIIYELGEEIFDPETSESLGCIEHVKGRVKVSHVQEKFSFASTPTRTIPYPNTILPRIFEHMNTVHDQLKVEEASVAVQVDLTVRIGDKARSVA